MAKCSFCAGKVPEGRGKVFVKTDGKIFNFCNSKCEKNWNMKRAGKNVAWTKAYAKDKGK